MSNSKYMSTTNSPESNDNERLRKNFWSRDTYYGALLFNVIAFLLPALYGTLSKFWVANIDTSMVVTVDSYTYIGVVAAVINEGLPRAAWVIIGDKSSRSLASRLALSQSLILFQSILGFMVSLSILGAAKEFASGFVPTEVRKASITYIRISSFSVFSASIEVAVANTTRALDHPDVPVIISTCRFILNIVLDLLLVSRFHVGEFTPSANLQAGVRFACDMAATVAGLVCLTRIIFQLRRKGQIGTIPRPTLRALAILLRPGALTFAESAVRNALYLWLVSNIVSMGSNYATAWGVFNTIRWGLIMVPVQSLEATTNTFIGHAWGEWRKQVGGEVKNAKADKGRIQSVTKPARTSIMIALIIEIPLCILLSLFGTEPFAHWISGSKEAAKTTAHMWRTIDWCYILFAVSQQLAAMLRATIPRWYLYQSLVSNIIYVLPWAIACQVAKLNADDAWTYHPLVFGGSLVFSFFNVLAFVMFWVRSLRRGSLRLDRVRLV